MFFAPGLAVGLGFGALAEVAKKTMRQNDAAAGKTQTQTLLQPTYCTMSCFYLFCWVYKKYTARFTVNFGNIKIVVSL